MEHARERSSKERAERKDRDARACNVEARTGPTLMVPGLAFDGIGNRALLALLRSGQLQRKARVAERSDPREHEVDRAADAAVSGARPAHIAKGNSRSAELQRMTHENEMVAAAADAIGQLHGGRSLDEQTRGLMESRFGESFADVSIHTGHRAGEMADALEARAFTVGQNIVFAEGTFAPETTEGKRLLAHELTHVAQQRARQGSISAPTAQSKPSVSESGDPLEVEADAAAERVVQDRNPSLSVVGGMMVPEIQRQPHDKPKKGQTPRDFTVERDHGRSHSYYIRFPHYIKEEDALQILFAHGKIPEGVVLEYQGVMLGGWTFRLRSTTAEIGPAAFSEFAPILQKHFKPETLSLTPEETESRRKAQEEFLDSRPIYLGGQTVREALTLDQCKDHVVPGQVGKACWGNRAGYFYWVGFDGREGGTVLEVKSSPKSPTIIKDWEWFLSHTPADYVPQARDLPYAATFDPTSKANFTLNETYQLENELKDWEFRQQVFAWANTFASASGAVRKPTIPPPSTYGQVLKIGSTAIQVIESWKTALGGEQSELDVYLMGLAGMMEHGIGFIGSPANRPTPKTTSKPPRSGGAPAGGGKKVVVPGSGQGPAGDVRIGTTEPTLPTGDPWAPTGTQTPVIEPDVPPPPQDRPADVRARMKEQGITDITERRAAIARAAEDAKAAEAAKQVEIEAAAQQSQPMVAAAGGSPAGGGTIQVGSVRSTASGRRGGGRSFTAVPPPPPLKPSPTKPAPAEVAPEYPLPESATPEFSAVTPRPSARKATPGWFTRRMQELLIKLRLGVPPEVLPDMQIGYAGRESSALVEGAAGRASRVAPTPSPETPVATTAEQAAPTPSATSTQQAAPTASAESFEQGALATSMLPSRVAAALPTARSEAAQPSEAVQRVALVDRMQSIVLSIAEIGRDAIAAGDPTPFVGVLYPGEIARVLQGDPRAFGIYVEWSARSAFALDPEIQPHAGRGGYLGRRWVEGRPVMVTDPGTGGDIDIGRRGFADFFGTEGGLLSNIPIEITTERALAAHLARYYLKRGLILTYPSLDLPNVTSQAPASTSAPLTRRMRRLPGRASRGSMGSTAHTTTPYDISNPSVETRTPDTPDLGEPAASADPSHAPDPTVQAEAVMIGPPGEQVAVARRVLQILESQGIVPPGTVARARAAR